MNRRHFLSLIPVMIGVRLDGKSSKVPPKAVTQSAFNRKIGVAWILFSDGTRVDFKWREPFGWLPQPMASRFQVVTGPRNSSKACQFSKLYRETLQGTWEKI